MIGHDDISMTDRYSHLSESRKQDLQETLAACYGQFWDADGEKGNTKGHFQ
jgi:hypothetical protein